jgi:eukaryotic-like serine/threonine-protein kinase
VAAKGNESRGELGVIAWTGVLALAKLERLMPDEFAGPHASTPPDDTADPLIGRTVAGKFAIEAKLGQGAMGAVYRARQLALEKVVAIKVLHQDRATDVSYAERFRREAKAASRLDHPNSIRVFDFGQEPDGLLYLAMEYIEGRDLRALLSEMGPFAPAAVADILAQVLAALAVAHDLGVLHRDLKPENIMIVRAHGDDGQPIDVVKVCDFGIAKLVEPAKGPAGPSGGSGRRTTEGLIVGTPEYMSPEQARGEPIDGRSDLYSVGVVLYELLVGQAPFEGDSALSIVIKHLNDAPEPPSARQLGVDAGLEAICLKALQKLPAHRFQSAREMRQALREAASSAPNGASVLTPPRLSSGRPYRATVRAEKSTLQGVTPVARATARRTRPLLATAAVATAIPIAIAGLVMGSRHLEASHPAPATVSAPTQAEARSAFQGELPSPASSGVATVASASGSGANVEVNASAPLALAAEHAALHDTKTKRPKTMAVTSGAAAPQPATEETAETAPSGALVPVPAAPPVERPPMFPTATTPAAVAAAPVAPEPAKPAYDLDRAHVEIALARNAIGATSSSITRTVSEAQNQMTACYRSALPRLSGALEGSGTLHVETDGEGVIADARWTGPLEGDVGRCLASAVNGKRVANVDTGSARADVPLTFKAR